MSVYFYGCITLDGYLADKNHDLDWLYQTGSPEETGYENFYNSMDITMMGKRTFCEIKDMAHLEEVYPTTINYVFTHETSPLPKPFIPVHDDITSFVKMIDETKNIWIVGGNTLLAPLLDQGMVDHIILQIAPVLLGKGIPLFTQKEKLQRFIFKEIHAYGSFAELVYDKEGLQ